MKNVIKKIMLAYVFLSIFAVVGTTKGYASENSGAGFTVTSLLNSQQRNVTSSYFDLHLLPEESSELTIEIKNLSDLESTFDITVNSAMTSSSMTPIFQKESRHNTLVPDSLYFSKIAAVPQRQIVIPAHSSKKAVILVKIPKINFEGKLYGGITVTREIHKEEKRPNQMTNQFSYTNAVVISQSDEIVQPDLKIGQMSIVNNVGLLNVKVPMELETATLLTDLSAKLIVSDSSGRTVQSIAQPMRGIAPQSRFDYLVGIDSKLFKPGTYQVSLLLHDKKGRKWQSKQTVEIKSSQIYQHVKKLSIQPRRFAFKVWYVVIGLILVILILILALLFVILRKK